MCKGECRNSLRYTNVGLSGSVRYSESIEGAPVSAPVAETARRTAHTAAQGCETEEEK